MTLNALDENEENSHYRHGNYKMKPKFEQPFQDRHCNFLNKNILGGYIFAQNP